MLTHPRPEARGRSKPIRRHKKRAKSLLTLIASALFFVSLLAVSPAAEATTRNNWHGVAGSAIDVSVGPNGQVWVVTPANNIYQRVNGAWERVAGSAIDVSVGPNGEVWVVTPANNIYQRVNNAWERVAGSAIDVSVGPNGEVWVTDSANRIFRRNVNTCEVLELDETCQSVYLGSGTNATTFGDRTSTSSECTDLANRGQFLYMNVPVDDPNSVSADLKLSPGETVVADAIHTVASPASVNWFMKFQIFDSSGTEVADINIAFNQQDWDGTEISQPNQFSWENDTDETDFVIRPVLEVEVGVRDHHDARTIISNARFSEAPVSHDECAVECFAEGQGALYVPDDGCFEAPDPECTESVEDSTAERALGGHSYVSAGADYLVSRGVGPTAGPVHYVAGKVLSDVGKNTGLVFCGVAANI